MSKHDQRLVELIAHEAAVFIARESSGQSMITVTRADLGANAERARVYVSVFPDKEVGPALSFLSRVAHDFRSHLAEHSRIRPLPRVEFILDEGELHRQHLDEVSKKL